MISEVDREALVILAVMDAFGHAVTVVEVRREVMERAIQLVKMGDRRPEALGGA